MPKLDFTPSEIKAYWDTTPKVPLFVNNRYSLLEEDIMFPRQYDALHPYYVDALKRSEDMRVHADGFYPYKLLSERRPNEPLDVQIYREKIWVAKTKPTFSKVLNSLAKIRRSADWMISYPDNATEFTRIADKEDLKTYCEENIPYFQSLTDWAFTALLRKYLIDPNAVVFVNPLTLDIPQTEYLQPYPILYDSINVLDYIDEDYAVLLNPYAATYIDQSGNSKPGHRMLVVTTQKIFQYDQVDVANNYFLTEFDHNLNYLPVFKLGGTLIAQTDNHFLYESKVAGMVPEFDEAARENSDLQAVKVLHQFPERWEATNADCKVCQGMGFVPNPNYDEMIGGSIRLECRACEGRGLVPTGPFSKMLIKMGNSIDGTTNIPTPPAGFIEKDVQIITIQENSVKQHLADALSAINFEFLINVPISQSGVSKQYDRNESNNTTHGVAEDIVSILDQVYKAIAYYRYKTIYPMDQIDEMLPTIPVPENYDLYSIADAQAALNTAKSGKTNPVIINAMEQDYSNKLFSADTKVRERLDLILSLDPLPNITEDEKMSRLSNKGITQISYVISSNIQEFVQQALEDDPAFADKALKDQKAAMVTMAKAVITENSATAKIVSMVAPAGQNGLTTISGDNPTNTPQPDAQTQVANGGTV